MPQIDRMSSRRCLRGVLAGTKPSGECGALLAHTVSQRMTWAVKVAANGVVVSNSTDGGRSLDAFEFTKAMAPIGEGVSSFVPFVAGPVVQSITEATHQVETFSIFKMEARYVAPIH